MVILCGQEQLLESLRIPFLWAFLKLQPLQVYKSIVAPWRFDSLVSGDRNSAGEYSKSVLCRILAYHVRTLRLKEFGSKLVGRVRRNDLLTLHFEKDVFESKKAFVQGHLVAVGDLCLGGVPCVILKCLQVQERNHLLFLAHQLRCVRDTGLFSWWEKSSNDVFWCQKNIWGQAQHGGAATRPA